MRKGLMIVALAGACLTGYAQKTGKPQPYANTITSEDLKKHLYIVAGPEMEGRETATEGQRKAAAYIENYFKGIGLLPAYNGAYQMPFPVYQDSLIRSALEINGKAYTPDKDFAVSLSNSYAATMLGSEVVFAGYGVSDSARDDYKGINARGKIVMILGSIPPGQSVPRRGANAVLDAAQKNGAAALLVVQINFPRRATSAKGFQTISAFKRNIYPNVFNISEQVARDIMGADFDSAKEAVKTASAPAKTYQANVLMDFQKKTLQFESTNVVGLLEGSDKKDEYLVITAHYDHLGKRGDTVTYFGADDDGSGTVSILELAEAFAKAKKEGKGPRRSIVFMAVSGEEKGLWGSAYYSDHPIFPLDKTTANLNIDMIGRIDPKRKQGDSTNYVYVVGDDKLSTDLRPISESVNKKFTRLELDYKYNDPNDTERIYFRSDHYNFARKGVPIIFYFNGTHADYHRPTDTPDKINYDIMKKRAQLVFYTAWEMANRNDMLKRDLKLEVPTR